MRPEFNRDHIVKNIRRFRAWRERLPLPSISAKSISISSKKTPSTLKDSKMAYQLSISDIIWNVLNNPSLLKEMYFGAGVDSKTKSEVLAWYLMGRVTSFRSRTINDIRGLRAILLNEENQQYRLRIQKVLDYSDLPGTFKGELRQNRSLSGEVWLQDEPFLTITTSQISEKNSKGKINGSEWPRCLGDSGLGVVTADLPQGNDMCGFYDIMPIKVAALVQPLGVIT
ncbi:hypothetical protein GLOIN_2v1790377 [Rhizophagus clarus]|uniref:Uncharacterized protein n=1 Tax=Rhizophagus clarus TaxID=94130 RepID=A0A8H3QQZ9_9GLOM|nr:hypothetical protein GLOIN_2v1790377 [Rhizophagus clarus]